MKIWKYQLALNLDCEDVRMPKGANILSFQMQGGRPTIWVLVNPDNTEEHRYFRIFITGDDIPDFPQLEYIGTAQDGVYVWHLFEETEKK